MRFSWIEAEWDSHYIREAEEIILKLVRLTTFQISSFS
jgi:hypothetical protein